MCCKYKILLKIVFEILWSNTFGFSHDKIQNTKYFFQNVFEMHNTSEYCTESRATKCDNSEQFIQVRHSYDLKLMNNADSPPSRLAVHFRLQVNAAAPT